METIITEVNEECESGARSVHHFSPERREAISRSLKGRKHSKAHNEAIGAAQRGKPKSEAHKAALREGWARRRERLAKGASTASSETTIDNVK